MQLSHALRLLPSGSESICVAFVGAGGKTTAMFTLAHELLARHAAVVVTATSHLGVWQIPLADHHIHAEHITSLEELPATGITLITGPLEGDRTHPIDGIFLSWLHAETKKRGIPLLVEADGSRGRPLKAPAAHEPPIPDFTNSVVVVAGLSGLGKPLTEEFVFRAERFREIGDAADEQVVTPEILTQVLLDEEGGLKNIPPGAKRIALLNQAETPELKSIGGKMAGGLLGKFDAVLVGSLQQDHLLTFERMAGILLAAGESKRFGQTKQLLEWKGKPFVRQVAETALNAGLSPVVVVTGANAEAVESAVKDLDVKIVRNENWQSGQASSIVSGVNALPQNIGGCLFLLADQPQVTAQVIRALVEAHTRSLSAILAPLVREEKRANPVLFDRLTFPGLLALTGDTGGRALFGKYRVEHLPWLEEGLLLDVDTPEDYERMKDL